MAAVIESAAAGFTSQIHRDPAALDELRDCWATLALECPAVTPWQQWDFIHSWWHGIATSAASTCQRDLRLVVVRHFGEVRMILPLQISRQAGLGMRWLEPIGMPDDIHRPRFAIGPLSDELYACALDAIETMSGEWDGLRLDEKETGDPELELLQRLTQERHWRWHTVRQHECPYLDLRTDWTAYLARRSSKLRKNLGSSRRRLASRGTLRLARFDSPAEARDGLDALLDVTARSWKQRDKIGLGSSQAYRDFYREFAGRMAAQGRVRIYCLYVGTRAIAATLAFIDGKTYYSTQIAHDAEFDAYSPGTLLESMEMQDLMQERRFDTFDFLGAALSNKRRWTETMHSTSRLIWLRRSLRAQAFENYYFRIKPKLNSIRLAWSAARPRA